LKVKRFRLYGLVLPVLLIILALPGTASAWTLPDIPGFTGGEVQRTPLEAPSGSFGEWLVRVYTTGGGRTMKATMMAGPGAGELRTPPEGMKTDDRPLGFGSSYEGITVEGKRALLEEVPAVGLALAVALADDATLTLESSSLSRENLLKAASAFVRAQ
jgi:hypothetical protein